MNTSPKGLRLNYYHPIPLRRGRGGAALIQLSRINGLPSRFRHLERHCEHTLNTVHTENAEDGLSLIMENGV